MAYTTAPSLQQASVLPLLPLRHAPSLGLPEDLPRHTSAPGTTTYQASSPGLENKS